MPDKKSTSQEKVSFHRIIALLSRQQVDFMDKLAKDSIFSCGIKLTYTKLISYLMDILIGLGIDGTDVRSADDLAEKIKNAITKSLITKSLCVKPEEKKEEAISQDKFNDPEAIKKKRGE